jgi:branched-chain amino acid transport system permease protein
MSRLIETSRLGYSLRAIKENEQAAEAMGVDSFRCKMIAYMLSAAPAAVAGAVYAHAILFVVTPEAVFGVLVIVQTLTVCLVGGAGTLWGPIIGAAIMIPVSEISTPRWATGFGIQAWSRRRPRGRHMYAPGPLLARAGACFSPGRAVRSAPFARPGRGECGCARLRVRGPEGVGAMIRVRDLRVDYDTVCAVRDLSLEVGPGEVCGLIGPNGAGKTTLFNVLNGFLLPERGEVHWLGKSITGLQPHVVCRLGIGRTFQVMRLFPHLTVLENVMVGAFAHGGSPDHARASSLAALDLVGLADRADVVPTGLTTLDLRLMELARCLATRPRLILLDEPLAGLSTDGVELMAVMIRRARSAAVTVAIIEHTIHALVKLADRLVVLDQGRRLAEGLPGEVTRTPAVIEAYLGTRWLARHGAPQHAEDLRP